MAPGLRYQSDAEYLASTYLTQTLEGLSQRRYVLHDPASYAAKQRESAGPPPADKSATGEEEAEESSEEEEEDERGRGKRDDQLTASAATGGQIPKAPKAIDVQCSGLTYVYSHPSSACACVNVVLSSSRDLGSVTVALTVGTMRSSQPFYLLVHDAG
jgi:hypothetical protein